MKDIKEFIERVFISETSEQKRQRGELYLKTKDDEDWKQLSYKEGDAATLFYEKYVDKSKISYKGHLAEPNRPFKEIYYFAFLDKASKQSIKSGLYVAYLLSADHKMLLLSLALGVSDENNKWNSRQAHLRQLAKKTNFDITVPDNLKLGTTANAKAYVSSLICYRKYEKDSLPSNEQLESDFKEMMALYDQCLNEGHTKMVDSEKNQSNDMRGECSMSTKEVIESINKYFAARKFNQNEEVVKNLYLSLRAKPFVILAGVSGTGKSKMVRLFSEAVGGKYKLIPVKPDWSDASDLLGHVDLDGNFVAGKLTEFLYEANKEENKDTPFFVCLDEMNLARVEYYFSDFLSVIETRHMDKKSGRVVTDNIFSGEKFTRDDNGAADKYGNLIISDNVYVIGTVNMDETTYPFSKKVLDRANTIEFSDIHLLMGFEDDGMEEQAAVNVLNSELKAKYIEFSDCFPSIYSEDIKHMIIMLEAVNAALKEVNSQVAYRVRNEMAFYLLYALEDGIFTYDQALDNELMQKILPRIQGSGKGVENALRGILNAIVNDQQFNDNELATEVDKYVSSKSGTNYPYKRSIEKIQFMLRRLEQDGYTSYWL